MVCCFVVTLEIYKSVAYFNYSREFREFHESHPITPGRGTTVGRMALEGKAVQIVDVLSDPEYTFTEAQKLMVKAGPLWRFPFCVKQIQWGR